MGRIKGVTVDDLGGGLNESASKNDVPVQECIECLNWRVSEGGKSKVPRAGLSKVDSVYSFGAKSVYGAFGILADDEVKLLACLEDDIQLKYGGAWGSVFSPTQEADRPLSIAKDKGLTFIAGYEKLITIKENDAFYSGIEAPPTAPSVAVAAASSGVKELEYPIANIRKTGELRQGANRTLLAQSFKVDDGVEVSKVVLRLKKTGAPASNVWVEIHSSTAGTSETKNLSTNIVGEASDDVACAGITTGWVNYDFDFSGTAPSLSAGVTYYLVLYGGYAVSDSAFVHVGIDGSAPSYSKGIYYEIRDTLGWRDLDGAADMCFEIYAESVSTGELLAYGARETGDADYPRITAARTLLAQSFELGADADLTSVKIPMRKFCEWLAGTEYCPTGNMWIEIHSSTVGTSGTKNASANIVGQASDNVTVASVSTGGTSWMTFTFSGTVPSITAATTYYIVFYGTQTISSTQFVSWTRTTGYSGGQSYTVNSAFTWTAGAAYDFSFVINGTSTGDAKVEEYALTNYDLYYGLRQNAATTLVAQSFTAPRDGSIYSVKLYVSKHGAPGGNLWVEIHSAQGGTSAVVNTSTNIVGRESDTVAIAGIDAFPTGAFQEFIFSTSAPVLTSGNTYYIVLYASYAVSATTYVEVGHDRLASDFAGAAWDINGAMAWAFREFKDLVFELYYVPSDLVGDYQYMVTFYRSGNFPCESYPGPASDPLAIIAANEFRLTNIPLSTESEVDQRRIYRTKADGAIFYWVIDIEDNTTTTLTDAAPDASLGDEVSYESYPPPAGKQIEIWDNKLWVAGVPGYLEDIFASGLGTPEQFPSTAASRIPLREGETDHVKTIIEMGGFLFALKSKCIWKVSKYGTSSHLVDKLVKNLGTIAPDSVAVCDKGRKLIFLSNHYRIETFNGYGIISEPGVPDKVKTTMASINKEYAYLASGRDYPDRGEYRLSIPTGSNTKNDTTVVFDYVRNYFYLDEYHQDLRSISLIDITDNERAMVFGTDEGGFFKVDEDATSDDGSIIECRFRTGWVGRADWNTLREIFLDYRLPEDITMVFKIYKDFEEDAQVNDNLAGNTPTGGDGTLRDIVHYRTGLYVPGSHYSMEFILAEDPGGPVEVIGFTLFSRRQRHKYTIEAD